MERLGLDPFRGFDDQREAARPIGTAASKDAYPLAGFSHQQPVAIVFDFMNPLRPQGNAGGIRREAWGNEARGLNERLIFPPHTRDITISRGKENPPDALLFCNLY